MARNEQVQIAPGKFPEPQQRALNDALARILPQSTSTVLTPAVAAGQFLFQIPVNMSSATYMVKVSKTWFGDWKINAQTSKMLTLEFAGAANAGDVLRVELT